MVTPEQVWLYLAGEAPWPICALLASWLDDGDVTVVHKTGAVASADNTHTGGKWYPVTDGSGETIVIVPEYRERMSMWAKACTDYRDKGEGPNMLLPVWKDGASRAWLGLPP